MRFERYNWQVVEEATTKLLLSQPISDKERLNIIRYLATAAKAQGLLRQWHNFLSLIDNYEQIPDYQQIDKILTRWIPKLEIPQNFEIEEI